MSLTGQEQQSERRESNPHDQLGRLRLPRLWADDTQVSRSADGPRVTARTRELPLDRARNGHDFGAAPTRLIRRLQVGGGSQGARQIRWRWSASVVRCFGLAGLGALVVCPLPAVLSGVPVLLAYGVGVIGVHAFGCPVGPAAQVPCLEAGKHHESIDPEQEYRCDDYVTATTL